MARRITKNDKKQFEHDRKVIDEVRRNDLICGMEAARQHTGLHILKLQHLLRFCGIFIFMMILCLIFMQVIFMLWVLTMLFVAYFAVCLLIASLGNRIELLNIRIKQYKGDD